MEQTKLYRINAMFAMENKLPVVFAARQLTESPSGKAVYVYGHGEMDPQGRCARCGRELTHPGSILIGIGPECLKDWGARDYVLDNLTEEDKERLRSLVRIQQVDTWLPKSIIKDAQPIEHQIDVPKDHKMLQTKQNGQTAKRAAEMVYYQNSGREAIKITFPFNRDDLDNVKSLSGRKFHNEGANKYWTCPLSLDSVEALNFWGFALDDKLTEFLGKSKLHVDQVEEAEIPGLKLVPMPFQKKGVKFIDLKDGRALVADEMGLGKTIQALAWLQLRKEKRPVIIVVPASLKLNWAREAKKWMEKPNVQILSGKKTTVPIIGEIIIINYDILGAWIGKLQQIKPQVLILDEVHYVKSNKAQRTQAVKMLGKNIPHVIALSGTPIVNRPAEIFNAINLIDKTVAPSWWDYVHKYCGAYHDGYGWNTNGATNTEELHNKLTNTIMIRRTKAEVLTDLPDKQRSFLPIELGNRKEYDHAERDFIDWVRKTKGEKAAEKASGAEVLTKIEVLKQLAVKGKLEQAINWIRDFVEVDGKLVVFATHKFVIDALMNAFKDIAVKVDGSVSGTDRDAAVQAFQNDDKIRLFVGNIKAAGVGLTLTAASNVAFLEFDWVVGNHIQAEDRCHRIGQKDSVTIYYLIAERTIEEKLAAMLDKKAKILASVLDGKSLHDASIFAELIEQLKED